MRAIQLICALLIGAGAQAAPPPDADGKWRDWFRSLTVPGSAETPCCSVADCRMVEARWNAQMQHYEAKVIREVFSEALRNSALYQQDAEAFRAAREVWLRNWTAAHGDVPEVWIEIPDARVNHTYNPTGQAILCWSAFYPNFNGVFCFVPFQAADNAAPGTIRAFG